MVINVSLNRVNAHQKGTIIMEYQLRYTLREAIVT